MSAQVPAHLGNLWLWAWSKTCISTRAAPEEPPPPQERQQAGLAGYCVWQSGWGSSLLPWDLMAFTNRETGTHPQCTCHPRSGQPLGS